VRSPCGTVARRPPEPPRTARPATPRPGPDSRGDHRLHDRPDQPPAGVRPWPHRFDRSIPTVSDVRASGEREKLKAGSANVHRPPHTTGTNPRIKSPLLSCQIGILAVVLCRFGRDSVGSAAGSCRFLTARTATYEHPRSTHHPRHRGQQSRVIATACVSEILQGTGRGLGGASRGAVRAGGDAAHATPPAASRWARTRYWRTPVVLLRRLAADTATALPGLRTRPPRIGGTRLAGRTPSHRPR
jgi:hypothetical protein